MAHQISLGTQAKSFVRQLPVYANASPIAVAIIIIPAMVMISVVMPVGAVRIGNAVTDIHRCLASSRGQRGRQAESGYEDEKHLHRFTPSWFLNRLPDSDRSV